MKKLNLFLGAVLLLSTSSLFAQNWAACDDCAIQQVTSVYHQGDTNVNLIDQDGTANYTNVIQLGTGQKSDVKQDGAANQLGYGGSYNQAWVHQDGNNNNSDIDQLGDSNYNVVWQSGSWNYAKQLVGAGWAEGNSARADQIGVDNASSQIQYYDNNSAYVLQSGSYNDAMQYQSSGPNNQAAGSDATIMQFGESNTANQTQKGSFNQATAEQHGIGNESSETQNAGSYVATGLLTNISNVLQIGMYNKSCVTQTEGTTGANQSYVKQFGDNNFVSLSQTANSLGSSWNVSDVNQMGDFNTACVEQNSFGGGN